MFSILYINYTCYKHTAGDCWIGIFYGPDALYDADTRLSRDVKNKYKLSEHLLDRLQIMIKL